MTTLTWNDVCSRRLARQFLTEPAKDMVAVTGAVCGVQAQIITSAELTLAARVSEITQQDVRRELWERRTLVKTYGPRGTLHLLPAAELPMWMSAMRARDALGDKPWFAFAELEEEQADAVVNAIGEALDGQCLTREELASAVAKRVGSWAHSKLTSTWGEMLPPAAYRGLLVFGPSEGSKVSFVRADQWVDNWKEVDEAEALKEVARRYIYTYGPVAGSDFARWFWLKPAEAKRIIVSLGDEVAEVIIEGHRAWVRSEDARAPRTEVGRKGIVSLVPQYDCYFLGCGQRERILPEAARKRIFSYGRGRLEGAVGLPLMLVDGVISGMWERHMSRNHLDIRVESFGTLSAAQEAQLGQEVERVGRFLDIEVRFSVGKLE